MTPHRRSALIPIALFLLGASEVEAHPWEGNYGDHSGRQDLRSLVRTLSISEDKDHRLLVRLTIYRYLTDDPGKPISLEAVGQPYNDQNNKGLHDTLIVSFATAKYKPMVVLQRAAPIEPILNKHSHIKHLSYSFYENSAFPAFVTGDVYRDK